MVGLLFAMTIVANSMNLLAPRLIAHAIDGFGKAGFNLTTVMGQLVLVAALSFVFTYAQMLVQTYASEQVARDLRSRLAAKLSGQTYAFVEGVSPAKLLTNLTSDVDGVKVFVSQAVPSIMSSIFVIIGASILLVSINWKLGLCILALLPIIGISLALVLSRVRKLFRKGQETIDWLNRVINESILGASLIRILCAQSVEFRRFTAANQQSLEIGLSILRLFSGLVPIITLAANLATFAILLMGGNFVIGGSMSLGDFAAFNTYLSILIFPIMILGFMSNVIAQAQASYGRLMPVLTAKEEAKTGTLTELRGDITVENVTLQYGEKAVLKNVSFAAAAGSATAITGPTAAGKTQLLHLLIGLMKPTSGAIRYDGHSIDEWDAEALHRQVGFVFQDSVLFNLTLRENIAFSSSCSEESLWKAIRAAELEDFISTLPQGLETVVSERGSSLSGGQKQRVMLARALALNPKVLLLDDFTARVDTSTEQAILRNVHEQYPGITLISVTQKIASVEGYDQIILLMEGELLATGTHDELMDASPEYVQIYDSQQSTHSYEAQGA
jgi:ATP-binding cassette subfamily B protein